jgi:hypothetical protein
MNFSRSLKSIHMKKLPALDTSSRATSTSLSLHIMQATCRGCLSPLLVEAPSKGSLRETPLVLAFSSWGSLRETSTVGEGTRGSRGVAGVAPIGTTLIAERVGVGPGAPEEDVAEDAGAAVAEIKRIAQESLKRR